MSIFGKTFSYCLETYGGLLFGIILFCLSNFYFPKFINWSELIKNFPPIGMSAFGFILTFLGIIIQGNSETINWMKSRESLYKRFIDFNKRLIYLSVFLSLFSYAISNVDLNLFAQIFEIKRIKEIRNIFVCFFYGFMGWFSYDLILFIKIFFLLINKAK